MVGGMAPETSGLNLSGHQPSGQQPSGMRIGELAARVGVTTATLRAWEARYGLLRPLRSTGGYRVYGSDDEARVRRVLALRAQGVAVSDAAVRVLGEGRAGVSVGASALAPQEFAVRMHAAVDRWDEAGLHDLLDRVLAEVTLGSTIDDYLMPFLHEVGERWARGELTIAREHFVSTIVHRRFGALTMGRHGTVGPLAVLATPSGEHHNLALLCLAALLTQHGWRVRFLGANTPVADVVAAALDADALVLSATSEGRFTSRPAMVRELGEDLLVALGGQGATARAVAAFNAIRLPDRISDSADLLSRRVRVTTTRKGANR